MKRQLTFFDILCLGVNAIVGSGIFLIPGRLLGGLGPLSIVHFALCGFLLVFVGLCYAEASSYFDRNGGPYNYAQAAFGSSVGFGVGWIAWIASILSYAAVARGLPYYLGTWIPGAGEGSFSYAISVFIIFVLGAINYRGVKLGAWTTNIFTVGKLVPLFLLALVGLFFIHPSNFTPIAPHGWAPMGGLTLAVVFAFQGFEVAPIPAGETANARSVVPKAVIGSLGLSALLYILIQAVVVGSGSVQAGSELPLAEAALSVFGPWGATLMTVGATISMTGFCAGIAFAGPRYITVLCEDGFLPKMGARIHPRFGTPYVSIIFISLTAIVLIGLLDFNQLVDLSGFAVTLQYLFTSFAIPFLRRKRAKVGAEKGYRLPGGWLIPALGVGVSILFLVQVRAAEFKWSCFAIVGGLLVSALYRLVSKQRSIL